ncbi:ABC transporter substrate-binding protein [Methyloversatilis discipulorum]|uniref:ABC transporter substrate-binding protein n=1 Tax=Methyloversatilis discipulorum TaxID=1119528 RepID=UPI001A628022|nr:ABC transporter substrate-binding protein [Methyloversatilis discipulorum]MBL8468319.1 ABC transporter substrate-binding protein [Methyloversatilis discipulorum]
MTEQPTAGRLPGRVASALRAVFAGVALMLLASCGEAPQLPLRVGLNPWVGYDPLVLARERGLFSASDLRVVELETSTESARQLRNGLIEAAGLTLPEAVELAAAGTDLRVVAVLSLSKGADAVLARPGIASADRLKGGRIGLEDTALASIMLQRLLDAGGLRRDEVSLVMLPVIEHESALKAGRVDAVITFEPVISRLSSAGFVVVLDSANMSGEVVDVLVVRADALQARPHQVHVLLTAFEAGRREMLARPAEAANSLAAGADLSVDEYALALSRVNIYSDAQSKALLASPTDSPALGLARLSSDLKASGRMMADPDWSRLFVPVLAPPHEGQGTR